MEFASLVAKAMSWKWTYKKMVMNGEPLEWPGNQTFAISWNICISWASTGIWWNHRKTILLTGRPLRHHFMGLKGLTAPFNWPQVLLSFKPSAFAHLSQHIGKAGPAQVGVGAIEVPNLKPSNCGRNVSAVSIRSSPICHISKRKPEFAGTSVLHRVAAWMMNTNSLVRSSDSQLKQPMFSHILLHSSRWVCIILLNHAFLMRITE